MKKTEDEEAPAMKSMKAMKAHAQLQFLEHGAAPAFMRLTNLRFLIW